MSKKLMPINGGIINIGIGSDTESTMIATADNDDDATAISLIPAELLALAMLCLERYNEIGEERIIEAKESDNG